jgi:hypothetical protein
VSVLEALKKARHQVAGGWSEPFCRDSHGVVCAADSEGVATFDVHSALALYATGDELWDAVELLTFVALPAAASFHQAATTFLASGLEEDALAAVHAAGAPGAGTQLPAWLERPGRKLEHVLKAFDLAILRASASSTNRRGAA